MDSALVVVEPQDFRRVAVVGDLHGDYQALLGLLGFVDLEVDLLVFLGDYGDRGAFGVEVVGAVAGLLRDYPGNVVALMGNHEDYTDQGEPRFSPFALSAEVESKLGSWSRYFRSELKPFLDALHLSVLVADNALLVHGGVSTKLTGIGDLRFPSAGLRMDILWSDPFDGVGEQPNVGRGAGVMFGADVSAGVCRAVDVERIVRSHQPTHAMTKPSYRHHRRVITVNATSVYGGVPYVFFVDPKSTKKDHYKNIQRS